ncbi:hypothetical protein J2127_001077 [Methanococcus voltae]|uniref:PKD domain-containing protein n=1 Tax=Methanococcus voltae TaxID=2188 RepID=UPI001AE3B80D|nr:PKD domain-containing protein [Methanococcus voltae]MBP2143908.1 hypothetical protein [Methanococcus voltae]
MKNMKKYVFLFLILLAFLSINSVSADFNYYTNIEVTDFEGTSATFPIYLVDRVPDFNNNGFIDNEDKLYFKQHQYALINYDCVKEDGSDIVAYMNGNIVPQKLDSFKINQLSENKIIIKGTTNEPTITLNIQYIDLNSTSHMISETVNVENTNYYYEMSTENIKDNSEINIEIPQTNTNIQGIINKKPIILSKLYVKITETGTLAVKFGNDNPPSTETITVQKNYCNYFIDNDVLTGKIIDIPASSTTNVYIEETSNPVIVSNPNEVYDYYNDGSSLNGLETYTEGTATVNTQDGWIVITPNGANAYIWTTQTWTKNVKIKATTYQSGNFQTFGFAKVNNPSMITSWGILDIQGYAVSPYRSTSTGYWRTWNSGKESDIMSVDTLTLNTEHYAQYILTENELKLISNSNQYVCTNMTYGDLEKSLVIGQYQGNSLKVKGISVQKYDENISVILILGGYKIINNNNYALNNYQIDINISDLNSPNYMNVYTLSTNEGSITSNSNIDYYSTGYQNEVEYPSIVKIGQSFELTINGELPTTTIVNWGDGSSNTMNSNTITHSYTKTGNYIITITYNNEITKNYDITVQEIEYTNYLVNFYYEDNSTKFNDSLVINTENLNKNTNDSINVSLPENSLIVVSYNNVVRSIYTSKNSVINIYMPSKTSYLSQVRLSSYYDDKITVKSTDNKIICENTKELNTYLITGKVYKIYINDVFYKDLTVDSAKDISLPYSNSNNGVEIQVTQNEKCIIIYGKSNSDAETLKVEFKSNYGNYTNNYKITSDMTIIQIDKSTIIDNINNTPNQFKVDLKIYDSSNKLIKSETMILINNKITENTYDSKLFSLVIALVILITLLIVPKSYFHMSLLMAGGVFAILSVYLENGLSIITVGFFTGLAIVYFIKSKMGK